MRYATLSLLAALCCPTGYAADREFKVIVQAISDEFNTKPMHIPLFGLVNAVTYVAHPGGAKHIDMAIFEDLGRHDGSGQNIAMKIRQAIGEPWKPFVQVRSNRNDELTLIWMRADGHDCKLLLTTIEPNEATVIQLKLDPEGLQRWLSDPMKSIANQSWKNSDRDKDDRD